MTYYRICESIGLQQCRIMAVIKNWPSNRFLGKFFQPTSRQTGISQLKMVLAEFHFLDFAIFFQFILEF